MISQNNFGLLSNAYDLARRGYPDEIFKYVKSLVSLNPVTLDIGCGTGISTRQLKEYGFEVVGVDKDSDMIKIAKRRSPEIKYFVSAADNLRFDSRQFDLVTAFNSFHWFNNEKSLNEIKRVLKNDGIFSAVLKISSKDRGDLSRGYYSVLKDYIGNSFHNTDNHFNKDFLIKTGFFDIREKLFHVDERYTVDEALILVQSLSLWNMVPKDKKSKMLGELRSLYESHLLDGSVIIRRDISIITAVNK